MPGVSPADYRVRLFLSADLSGSTAYKNSPAGLERQDGVPTWVSAFQNFYVEFPSLLEDIYARKQVGTVTGGRCPQLWKAIGDELVFCGRVYSRVEIARCIDVFVEALHDYRRTLSDAAATRGKIDLKGAAWLAAFPEPNLAVRLRRGSDDIEHLSMSEALEAAADAEPFAHDFLGKAIDTGFRVGASAERSRFAVSVQLARVLLSLKPGDASSHTVRADLPRSLKGLNEGAPYPVLYIDTMEDFPFKAVREQGQDLFGGGLGDSTKLRAHLDAYCTVVGTEDIALPDNFDTARAGVAQQLDDQPVLALPQSYTELREMLTVALEKERSRGGEDQDRGEDPENGSQASFPDSGLKPPV